MVVRGGAPETSEKYGGNSNKPSIKPSRSASSLVGSFMKSWGIPSLSSYSSSSSAMSMQERSPSGRNDYTSSERLRSPTSISSQTHENVLLRKNSVVSGPDGNFDAMSRQLHSIKRTTSASSSSSYSSPLRYISPSLSGIESPHSKFFRQKKSDRHSHSSDYTHKNGSSGSSTSNFYSNNNGTRHSLDYTIDELESPNRTIGEVTGGNKGYFEDLDEDWSAAIDDYNMPVSVIINTIKPGDSGGGSGSGSGSSNGTVGNMEYDSKKNRRSSSQKPMLSRMSSSPSIGSHSGRSVTMYPQLPTLHTSKSSYGRASIEYAKSEQELKNEREVQELNSLMHRIDKFDKIILNKHLINLQELRQISWNGIPKPHRPTVWKLLIGYLPANTKRQTAFLKRKRQEYNDYLQHTFSESHKRNQPTWHQIEIDIPRTNPHIPLYQFKTVQNSLQRILYLWAIRHPTSGYVQGINDLVSPFFEVFLTAYLPQSQIDDVEKLDPASYMTAEQISELEADTFWCLTKLLEQITDNYIHGQPGIFKQVKNLSQLVKRIDAALYNHFQKENVEFIQFAFRWMNCLLMREFPMNIVIRMWDTYLAETSLSASSTYSTTASSSNSTNDQPSSNQLGTPSQTFSPTFGVTTPSSGIQTVAGHNKTSKLETPVTKNIGRSPSTARKSPFGAGSMAAQTANSMVPSKDESAAKVTPTSLNEFHVFVCAAFLIRWSDQLCEMDFQGIITFLQNPPTSNWNETDIEMLLSEAYIWQFLYKDATSHWQ